MGKLAAAGKRKLIDFVVFAPLYTTLLEELSSGRLSSGVLPPVIKPEVLQYAKQMDNVVERALYALSKFKKPAGTDVAGLLADENHAQLAGVLDGQALLSVMAAHYLCKYDAEVVSAREHFQKLDESIRLRVLSDTDTFSMPKDEPTPLHAALHRCFLEDTADAMGQLAVAVQQDANNFDNKATLLRTAHAFAHDVSDISQRMAKPPRGSEMHEFPGARIDDVTDADRLSYAPPAPPPAAPAAPAALAAPEPLSYSRAHPSPADSLVSPPPKDAFSMDEDTPEVASVHVFQPPAQSFLKPNKRNQFFDHASRIGVMGSDEEDQDGSVHITLMPKRKAKPFTPSFVAKTIPMDEDEDDLIDLKHVYSSPFRHPPRTDPGRAAPVVSDDDDMPTLAGK